MFSRYVAVSGMYSNKIIFSDPKPNKYVLRTTPLNVTQLKIDNAPQLMSMSVPQVQNKIAALCMTKSVPMFMKINVPPSLLKNAKTKLRIRHILTEFTCFFLLATFLRNVKKFQGLFAGTLYYFATEKILMYFPKMYSYSF